ncbi:hypothetical protein FRC98_17995 [Lujinxingia vulgaris]|uniref:Uncharacterized protein n=1 Tax=Lujinxingia vulgaris TaxID=2600176 RepID=A0A5C6X6N5_9DELT|nr:hypothetical protein [Lujinxingia vulgaris]TXD34725.1 hypothetical protein FRC98_17995 [Lujinxingia vulgaris]
MNFELLVIVVIVGFGIAAFFGILQNISRMQELMKTKSYWRTIAETFNLQPDAESTSGVERLVGSHRACPLILTGKGDPLSEGYELEAEIDLVKALHKTLTLISEPDADEAPTIDTVYAEGPTQAHELLQVPALVNAWNEAAAFAHHIEVRDAHLRLKRRGALSDETILEELTELSVSLAIVLENQAAKFPTLTPEGRKLPGATAQAGRMPVSGELHSRSTSPMKGDFFEEKAGFPVRGEWDRSGEFRAPAEGKKAADNDLKLLDEDDGDLF